MAARAGGRARQEGLINQDGSPVHLQRECHINFLNCGEGIAERERARRMLCLIMLCFDKTTLRFAAFVASHAAAAFLEFARQQSDFGWCGYRAYQWGAFASDHSKARAERGSQRCDRYLT
jgi:hypothetical protein